MLLFSLSLLKLLKYKIIHIALTCVVLAIPELYHTQSNQALAVKLADDSRSTDFVCSALLKVLYKYTVCTCTIEQSCVEIVALIENQMPRVMLEIVGSGALYINYLLVKTMHNFHFCTKL